MGEIVKAKSKDLKLLLGILAGEEVPAEIPEAVVDLAERAMVLEVIAAREEVRAISERAHKAYLSQAALGALRLKELKEIAEAMAEAGIEIMVQKGMAYGLMFETGGPTRAMADIDLLVRDTDYQKTGAVMHGLGYEEGFAKQIAHAKGHHERQFTREGRLVEIHRAFLRGRRITVDYDALWQRAETIDTDGVHCLRMSAEDTFVYHCFHWGMHEFVLAGLRSAWEARRLCIEDGPDMRLAALRAKEWGTARTNWCAMRITNWCFEDTFSKDMLAMFEPQQVVKPLLEKYVIEPSIESLTDPGFLPRHVQLFRKALLVDSLKNAASYLLWYAGAMVETRGKS